MAKKEHFYALLRKTIKVTVALFTLSLIGWFVSSLPFARELPFISHKLTAAGFLNAVVSLLMVIVFVKFGSEIGGQVDPLLEFLPGAGALAANLVRIAALLFSYGAFQDVVYPFIRDYEWAYQAVFLGVTLFFLARAGLIMYAASDGISGFLMSAMNPYRAAPAPVLAPVLPPAPAPAEPVKQVPPLN